MPRDIKVYTSAMAMSSHDKKYIQKLRSEMGLKSDAGTLAYVINEFRTKVSEKTVVVDDVAQIIDLFIKSVNPFLKFGNRTERNFAQMMIDKWGFNDAIKVTKLAISVQGKDEYAPTISKPSELVKKWGRLQNYVKGKQTNNSKPTSAIVWHKHYRNHYIVFAWVTARRFG